MWQFGVYAFKGVAEMKLKNNPCYKCTTETGRHIGCHSTCPKYIKANEEHNKLKEEIRKKAG